ncbi:hypothetical protein PoB_004755700 [Plakobranchus ocellatus]|uniref:Uncharacterized protein n=1 Tax=Plakobranchus ocellatus TaxID=259542 RepID=A0AAV4BNW2_9GAST|nr:hypothetical protein PoB_004755700 [Plakobranchus ocellatus]
MHRQFKKHQETTECDLPSNIKENGGQGQSCLDSLYQYSDYPGMFDLQPQARTQQTHVVKHTPSTSDTTAKHLVGHTDTTHTYLETNTNSTEISKSDKTTALDTSYYTVLKDTSTHIKHSNICNIGNT